MESIGNPWLYLAFFAIVAVMLLIDFMGFKQKKVKKSNLKQLPIGVLLGSLLHHSLVVVYGFTCNKQLA